MQRGFTLIETLVYLALFGIMVGGFVVSAYGMFESSDRNLAKAMLQQEKNFAMGTVQWALSGAQTVSVPAVGASAGTLTLTKYGGTVVSIMESSGVVLVNGNPITNSNVVISNLVFIHTHPGGTNPESVEAGFTISARTPDGKIIAQTASTTRYIRK